MTHTDSGVQVALAIKQVIEDSQTVLGIDSVRYGTHNNIPQGLSVTVTPARKARTLVGVQGPGGRTENEIFTLITVYNSVVGDEEAQREVVDQLAESVEGILHNDTSLGDIIIHGFVEMIENGDVSRLNSMFRTVRLVHKARTRTLIQ